MPLQNSIKFSGRLSSALSTECKRINQLIASSRSIKKNNSFVITYLIQVSVSILKQKKLRFLATKLNMRNSITPVNLSLNRQNTMALSPKSMKGIGLMPLSSEDTSEKLLFMPKDWILSIFSLSLNNQESLFRTPANSHGIILNKFTFSINFQTKILVKFFNCKIKTDIIFGVLSTTSNWRRE